MRRRLVVYWIGLTLVFAAALGVRLIYRSDRAAAFDEIMPYQSFIAHRRAQKILAGEGILLWDDTDPRMVRQIRRPPGYAAFLAGIYLVTGPDLRRAQVVQIVLDSLAAAAVALFAGWLVAPRVGAAAGMLYALSPHLAVFSTIVTPDAPAAWPIFAGGALFILAFRSSGRWSYAYSAVGGIAIGLSCWLTAQGLTLPVALGVAGLVVAKRGERRRALALGGVLLLGTIVAVGPLTARNVAVYGAMVPVRPGLGVTLVEGLGVYDAAFPATDGELLADEAARSGRPEYARALYEPDGLERERDRVGRALEAIRARPVWFVRVMLDRMGLMLTYDSEGQAEWPDNTAYVGSALAVQRLLFRTWVIWLLAISGIAALIYADHWRTAVLLAAVPIHHVLLQSLLLTEYKYTLPVHAWIFMLAGASLYWHRKATDEHE